MADDIEKAVDRMEEELQATIRAARHKARIPPGEPGECRLCFEERKRLVRGVCAPCRDEHRLP